MQRRESSQALLASKPLFRRDMIGSLAGHKTNNASSRSSDWCSGDFVDVDLGVKTDSSFSSGSSVKKDSNDSILQMLVKKTSQLWQIPKIIKKHLAKSGSKSEESIAMSPIPMNYEGNKKSTELKIGADRENWKIDQELIARHRFIFHPSFAGRYRLHRSVGEGSFGFVWRGECIHDGRPVAVKFIRRAKIPEHCWLWDADIDNRVPSEIFHLRRLMHSNIVRYIEHFDDMDYVYLVTELFGTSWALPNGRLSELSHPQLKNYGHFRTKQLARPAFIEAPSDLFECIEAHKLLPASVIKHIFCQVVSAVLYMHRRGIVHRDIKDENVLVNERYDIQIIDFGSASSMPSQEGGYFTKFNGTMSFAAPEVSAAPGSYSALKAESWTLGVLLFTMAFKRPPFSSSQSALMENLVIPSNSLNSRELQMVDLMRRLLEKDPSQRMAIATVPSHPWLASTLSE
jgi:hypothetical protein